MAESFAGGESLVVCLGDNIFEHVQADAVEVGDPEDALIFVKEVPDRPLRRRRLRRGRPGLRRVVEKAGVVDLRYEAPPTSDAVVGLYCYPPDVFEIIRSLEPSSRNEPSRSPT